MLVVANLCLCLLLLLEHRVTGKQRDSLWLFREPGDIMLHGLYPIRKHYDGEGFGLNYEGITWMGAMIHRIREINEEKLLPGNLTLGYAIRDTRSEVKAGLRQTLAGLHEIVNGEQGKQNTVYHVPVILGPANDELELASVELYKMFDVLRIAYTTTSRRFSSYSTFGKMIRTAPSDSIHIEALLRLINYTKPLEISVLVSKSSPWIERMKLFEACLGETKNKNKLKDIIYVDTRDTDSSVVLQRITGNTVVIFAESNITRLLTENKNVPKVRTWIRVNIFDDPLLSVFDTSGKLAKEIIVRNVRSPAVDQYRSDIAATLHSVDNWPNWLKSVFEKQYVKSKISPTHNESRLNDKYAKFRERIITAIGHNNTFRSSLTLQGIIDAVNLIIRTLKHALRQCSDSTPRRCLRLSGSALFDRFRGAIQVKQAGQDLDYSYSIEVLNRVNDPGSLGSQMKMTRDWTYQKLRSWQVTKSYIQAKLRAYWDNGTQPNNAISFMLDNHRMGDNINSSSNESCARCNKSTNQSNCMEDNAVINWTDTWAIAIYFLESASFLAVLSALVYFSQHKNSPIMILCYSWPDNIILVVLCVFSLLPMMHIGQMSPLRCTTLWPIINIIFTIYPGLLLTKTLFIQSLLKCEVATERPARRMAFAMMVTFTQLLILASLFIFDFPKITHLSCSSRETVTLCNIEGNISILVSMVFNWLLLSMLFVLSVTETLKQRQNFCRTENLVAVATVAWLSYTCLAAQGYFNRRVENYLAVSLVYCVIYLVNSAFCLGLIYVPTLRLVSTWLRQHTRQQKNLTSIKRAQVMSSKRQSSGPMRDSIFGANFLNEQLTIPSGRHSGYYFDLRPSSAATDLSYPTSLVRSVHEHTHVVFGYGRGATSLNGATSVESVPSIDWLEAPSLAQSAGSSYDNISQAAEETADELTPQELLHEISTYWERHRSSDVIANGQNEDNIEENKWPSLEKLRTSVL